MVSKCSSENDPVKLMFQMVDMTSYFSLGRSESKAPHHGISRLRLQNSNIEIPADLVCF